VTAETRKSRAADQRSVPAPPAAPRTADREADHAAIDRLADDLVPALIAKLSATGLGEIEVGEGDWTVRVRRPADAGPQARRDRPSRGQPGHAGHGHPPGGFEAHRATRDGRPPVPAGSAPVPSSNGSAPVSSGIGDDDSGRRSDGADPHRAVATSPAVGTFQPRAEARTGTRVRSGDRLGAVDMLGIPQEVVAPADGIVGASLVEAGEAVEYGQELIVIELAARAADRSVEATPDRVDA
jgi:biotin carboxyl carrier protein